MLERMLVAESACACACLLLLHPAALLLLQLCLMAATWWEWMRRGPTLRAPWTTIQVRGLVPLLLAKPLRLACVQHAPLLSCVAPER
jgi:hypothetical protein